jgi:hypothetical protein
MEELTPGQAAVLVRNEQVIDRAKEEAEDLEEMLAESIADSIRGRKRAAAGAGKEPAAAAARKKRCGCLLWGGLSPIHLQLTLLAPLPLKYALYTARESQDFAARKARHWSLIKLSSIMLCSHMSGNARVPGEVGGAPGLGDANLHLNKQGMPEHARHA